MAINLQSIIPAVARAVTVDEDAGLNAGSGEKVTMVIATSLAVLVVALIAVLMGMT
jgi:hypothetical protein